VTHPIEWLREHRVKPVRPGTFFFIREDPARVSSGGIIFSSKFAEQFRKANGWVIESLSDVFSVGDLLSVSVGVSRHMIFGEGEEAVDVFIVTDGQVEMRFPCLVELDAVDDGTRHPDIPLEARIHNAGDQTDEGLPSARPVLEMPPREA
jgi:hypothetical protein